MFGVFVLVGENLARFGKMTQNEKTAGQKLTTKVVSEALGYSQQSVRNAIKALRISPEKAKGGYVLTAKQAGKIARHFGVDADFSSYDAEESEEEPQEDTEGQQESTSEIELLKSVVQTLQEQLEEKDKQIERLQTQMNVLLEINKALSASNAAKQVAETKELLIADSTEQKPKGFWSRLFNK